jgi:hypothetical protein
MSEACSLISFSWAIGSADTGKTGSESWGSRVGWMGVTVNTFDIKYVLFNPIIVMGIGNEVKNSDCCNKIWRQRGFAEGSCAFNRKLHIISLSYLSSIACQYFTYRQDHELDEIENLFTSQLLHSSN